MDKQREVPRSEYGIKPEMPINEWVFNPSGPLIWNEYTRCFEHDDREYQLNVEWNMYLIDIGEVTVDDTGKAKPDARLEMARNMIEWFMEHGYEDEIGNSELMPIYTWLQSADTSGKSLTELCQEYELQMW